MTGRPLRTAALLLALVMAGGTAKAGNAVEGGKIAEAQATAEGATYDEEGLLRLLRLARIGCNEIFAAQEKAVRG